MSDIPGGQTWFLRCADCQEMYVASSGFNWQTGAEVVCWTRPRAIKKPTPCKHQGKVQYWNGSSWVDGSVAS